MEVEVMKREMAAIAEAPKPRSMRAAYLLSAMVAVLSAAVSVAGLAFPVVYAGNWGAAATGNDLVTLVVAVPLIAMAMVWSARGSVRGRLLWLGALYYSLYALSVQPRIESASL